MLLRQCPASIKTLSRVLEVADALVGPIHKQNVFGNWLYSFVNHLHGRCGERCNSLCRALSRHFHGLATPTKQGRARELEWMVLMEAYAVNRSQQR
jgi:hypothetical protein